MPRLTETFASKLPHSSAGTQKHWDAEVRGFGLFVGKRAKTWYYQRDLGGRTQRVMIGRYPVISAASARQAAQSLALDMSRGAGKVFQTGAPKLEDAMNAYLARPKLRSDAHRANIRSRFQKYLRDWLGLPLDQITRGMVAGRHATIASKPVTANHTFRAFRAVWNHARRTHDLSEAPTLSIEWFEERPDWSVIEDLATWRTAVDGLENPIHAAFYRLLLFTGLRRTEALTLRWSNILEDRIHVPMTKNGRPFDLPTLDIHQEILAPMRGLSHERVFPSPKSADGHLVAPERLLWSAHAHRRTFATVAVEAGVLEEVVGRLLNHTPVSITGRRYAKPSLDALRLPMAAICEAIEARLGTGLNG